MGSHKACGGVQMGEVQVEPRHLEALVLKPLLGIFSFSIGNKEVTVLLFLEKAWLMQYTGHVLSFGWVF